MPQYNVSVKDVSPLISYSAGWGDGANDDFAGNYTGGRFHATATPNAYATLDFYGTACYLFGAKRPNHGQYTVTIDNGSPSSFDGLSDPDQFQQLLFSKTDFDLGNHTITVTNGDQQGKYVDIDYIIFTTGDGKSDAGNNSTFDDTDTSVTYSGSDWNLQSNSVLSNQYHNDSFHTTKKKGATATINFQGNAAYIFGGTNTGSGLYDIAVDNGPLQTFNGSTLTMQNFQVLLYYTGTLSSGSHSIVMTNAEDGQELDLDFVMVNKFADNSVAPASPPNPRGKAKTPIIAGAASGAFIAVAWIIALLYFYARRHKRRQKADAALLGRDGRDTERYIIPPDPAVMNGVAHAGEYRHPNGNYGQGISLQPRRAKAGAMTTQTTNRYNEAHNNNSNADSSGSAPSHAPQSSISEYPPSPQEVQEYDANGRRIPAVPQSVSSYSNDGYGDLLSSPETNPSGRGLVPLMPTRAQELTASRMIVPDRPQDFGPIREEDLESLTLPPNYQQATQPFQAPTPPSSNRSNPA